MCQPKSQGGKRCLAHSAGTKAVERYTIAKTGADADMVRDTLKELNKEGRRLPAPSEADVKELFDRTAFAAEHDPDLEQKDRNNILKNVEKAQEEADRQGVTGGAFHAWKNLMKRVMGKMTRSIKVIGTLGVVGLALAACGSGDQPPVNTTQPQPNPSQSSQPAEPTDGATTPLEDTDTTDNFIPVAEVTDEYGTYTRVSVDPNSPLLQLNDSVVDNATLEEHGFTREQALEAQQEVVTYMVEEYLDSERLDNYSQTDAEWLTTQEGRFSEGSLQSIQEDGAVASGFLLSQYLPTPISRDGGPRGNMAVEVTGVNGYTGAETGDELIGVGVSFTTTYVTTDVAAQEALARNTGRPATDFRDSMPTLFDGDPEVNLVAAGEVWIGYNPQTKQFNGSNGSIDIIDGDTGISIATGD